MGGNILGLVVLGFGLLLVYLGVTGRYNKLLSALGGSGAPVAGSPGSTPGAGGTPPDTGRQPGQVGPS